MKIFEFDFGDFQKKITAFMQNKRCVAEKDSPLISYNSMNQ